MTLTQSLPSNIWKLSVITGLRHFIVVMPIIVHFFQNNGLSMTEVLLLQTIFSIVLLVCEVPSGYFSDTYGRKISIVAGTLCAAIGLGLYLPANGFWGFLAAEVMLAIGGSFLSGADSALLYDSLLALGKQDTYKKIQGRLGSIQHFSEGSAAVLGGFLAAISLKLPFIVEFVFTLIAVPIAFTLTEPPQHKPDASSTTFQRIKTVIVYALHGHAEVKWLMIYAACVSGSTLTMVWFIQPYFTIVGLPLILFGVAWAVLQFCAGFCALWAHRVEAALGKKRALMLLIMLSASGYALVASFQTLWALGFLFMFYFVRGIGSTIIKDYINNCITSDIRATVLSIQSFFERMAFVVIGPFIGWLFDVYSFAIALYSAGSIFLIGGIIALLFMHKHRVL